MKYCVITILLILSTFIKVFSQQSMMNVVEGALCLAEKQSLLLAKKHQNEISILPRTFENGILVHSNAKWWSSGFYPGLLWYLYEATKNDTLRQFAQLFTQRLEHEQYSTNNHDIGFILNCSFGNGYKVTKDTKYKKVLLTGANSLSNRYNTKVGLIRSWDFNEQLWQYPVIIDNMMNLELLMWASKNGGGEKFKQIAVSHANKTLKYHYRKDYSSFHVVSYDTLSFFPHRKQTWQGYNDSSSWSRGQSWGLYGYTMMYRETKDIQYLNHACNIANYMIQHKNMPADYIPYWDFDAPDIPFALRDASAASIMASALIELSQYVGKKQSLQYLLVAEKQIRTLATSDYSSLPGENGGFILKHSVGFFMRNTEVDVPLTYADYYYVEALLRYKKLKESKSSLVF